MKSIPKEQYVRLEWQANAFAGHLLVPTPELRAELSSVVHETESSGLDPRDEAVQPFIFRDLARTFKASSDVIRIRIEKERLLA